MREPRDPLLKVVLYRVKRIKTFHETSLRRVCKDVELQKEDRVFRTIGLQRVHRCEWMRKQSVHMPHLGGQQQPVFDDSVMILPQVHLRKPCYDFYFL